jgi:hypothetical protein
MTIIQKKAELLQFSIDLEDPMQIILLIGSIPQIVEEVRVSTGLLHRLEVGKRPKIMMKVNLKEKILLTRVDR